MVRSREDQLNIKINRMEEQVNKATEVVNDISQRVFNMENNKKNNLIFNGIVQEDGENKVSSIRYKNFYMVNVIFDAVILGV